MITVLGLASPRRADVSREITGQSGSNQPVADIRGRGLLIDLKMVADEQTKSPFAPTHGIGAGIKKMLFRLARSVSQHKTPLPAAVETKCRWRRT